MSPFYFFRPLLAAALLILLPSTASADVLVKMKSNLGAEEVTSTMMVKSASIRMTLGTNMGTNDVLFRPQAREMIVLDHQRRSYTVIDGEFMRSLGSELDSAMDTLQEHLGSLPTEQRNLFEEMLRRQGVDLKGQAPSPPEVRKVGRAEHVGYGCTLYDVTQGGKKTMEICTVEFSQLEGAYELHQALLGMKSFYDEMVVGLSGSSMFRQLGDRLLQSNPFAVFGTIDGFPVMSRDFDNGRLQSESYLESYESTTLPASDFEIPSGYVLQEIPLIGG